MVATGSSITDWISAVSTASLGVLGFAITGYQWRRTGFSPLLTSRIDFSRQGIELRIVNRGRAAGIIDQVDVARSNYEILNAEYEGFTDRAFRSLAMPALGSLRIIIEAPQSEPFPADVRLLVGLGGTKFEEVVPIPMPEGVGIYGLASVLPPGTST